MSDILEVTGSFKKAHHPRKHMQISWGAVDADGSPDLQVGTPDGKWAVCACFQDEAGETFDITDESPSDVVIETLEGKVVDPEAALQAIANTVLRIGTRSCPMRLDRLWFFKGDVCAEPCLMADLTAFKNVRNRKAA